MKIKSHSRMFVIAAMFALMSLSLHAQKNARVSVSAADEAAIRANVKQMEDGWNTKSGALFAKPFAEDADYVVINGLHIRTRRAIDEGHQRIFETIYKDSQLTLNFKQLRFLRPDVALVHVSAQNKVRQTDGERTLSAVITMVMVKEAHEWKIAAFQNTQDQRQPAASPAN